MILTTKPGGDICTVIDEGVLNTEGAADIRRLLLKQGKVLAVIQLPSETFKPNKINVKASVIHLQPYDKPDENLDANYPIKFIILDSLGYEGSGESIRGFDFPKLVSEISDDLISGTKEKESGYQWTRFMVSSKDVVSDPTCRFDVKYWNKEVIAQIEKMRISGGSSVASINTIKTDRGKSPPAELYVNGPPEGYALVVKAGTNVGKNGYVLMQGDWVEKQVFDEHVEAHLQDGDILISSTGDGTLGKCATFRGSTPAMADGHVTIVRVDQKKIYPEFVCDYLRAGFGATQISRLFTGSTGLIELTPTQVDSIVLPPLPSIKKQKAISKNLRAGEATYSANVEGARKTLIAVQEAFFSKTS